MCGIAGVFSTEPVQERVVASMLAAIAYRGPDHQGIRQYRGPNGGYLTVGQARLAIVDLSPDANQPFESPYTGTNLTFNGEFYNFLDLKPELERLGHQFRTHSDTEVALAALDQWGEAGLDRLWGMFAGVYFDPKRGEALFFRDRLGKKPLYFYQTRNCVYFASEPKAILAALDHVPEPNPEALAYYFYLGYVPTFVCAYQGMYKLAAGHLLKLNQSLTPKIEQWYKPEPDPRGEAALKEIFFDSVQKRMIADVPLAAFLSGGLDSSLVVAAMSQLSSQKVNTFSVRFEGPQALDESPYARAVAAHCQTQHTEVVLNTDKLLEAMPQVLDHIDEPFGDSSAVPMYLVSRAAREHFTVALSGDGADEVFAGYRKYLTDHYLNKLGPYGLRKMLWKPLFSLLPTGRSNKVLETARRLRRVLAGDGPTTADRHINMLHMSPIAADRLSTGAFPDMNYVRQQLRQRLPLQANLNDCLQFDQDLVLQDDMFVKVDRMSMKASLEVRSPFVDHRMVALANSLSPNKKLQGTIRKKILIDVLGDMLPAHVLHRPKTGFEMPIGSWLRHELRSWTEDRLFHHGDTSHWVDQEQLRNVWKMHCSGKLDCTETIWFHLVFATWLKGVYQ